MWITTKQNYTVTEASVDYVGHLNNLAYLQAFEIARMEMIGQGGFDRATMLRLKLSPVILSIEVHFKKEVRLGATLTIETVVVDYPGKVGKLRQKLVAQDGTVCCEADYQIGLFDMIARRLVVPTPEWLFACGKRD